jgi:hypothetical protein
VFDAFAELDCVGEHVINKIGPRDQVGRSGWVGFRQQILPDLLVGGDRVAFNDEAGDWSMDFAGTEPKQMWMGLARMSAMLSGKMTSLVEAIELHKEP